jgi:hypothetical protein
MDPFTWWMLVILGAFSALAILGDILAPPQAPTPEDFQTEDELP